MTKTTTEDDYSLARRALTTTTPPWWPPALAVATLLVASLVSIPSACSASSTQTVIVSPTPDSGTRNYIALVHDYYDQYVTARGRGYSYCVVTPIDPPKCRERAIAMVAVHEKFLKDLDSTPAPPKFVAEDRAIRSQLPRAIADLKAMIAAVEAGNESALSRAASAYIQDMIPTVTHALHTIDPSWPDE